MNFLKINNFALGIVLLSMISGFVEVQAAEALGGMRIESSGTFLGAVNQKRLFDLLVKDPSALMSDIDFAKEKQKLEKMHEELLKKSLEKLGKFKKRKTTRQTAKVERLLATGIGFVHEDYIWAEALDQILSKNPYLVNVFKEEGSKKTREAELSQTKKEYAAAFNALAQLQGLPLTYEQYQMLHEQYAGKPFFKLIHNIRECINCGISYSDYPFIPEYFYKKVVDYVTSKHPDKNEQLVITEYASGNLFQIFTVLNKLVALGYKNLRLNLIDPEYTGIIRRYIASGKAEMDPSRSAAVYIPEKVSIQPGAFEVSRADAASIGNLSKGLEGYVSYPQDPGLAFAALQSMIDDSLFNNTFAYFKQWFNGLGVNLELVVYDSVHPYFADIEHDRELMADLLLAVDYCTECFTEFNDLRMKGLKDTGAAFSVAHTHDESGNKVDYYFSVGSQKKSDMSHFKWDLSAKKLVPIAALPGTLDYYVSNAQLADLFAE